MKSYSILNQAPRCEDIWGVQFHAFLTLIQDGREWSACFKTLIGSLNVNSDTQ